MPENQKRISIITCMKDEGPFILEWLAWHKAAGVTDFLIFTNDCTDGTKEMLDYLDRRGIVQHVPNPAGVLNPNAPYWQPVALGYATLHKEYDQADYIISMDVDEFINVQVGDGTLKALFDDVGDFDALSMSEVNHGSNMQVHFENGWVQDLFPCHIGLTPGEKRAHRGVKTIIKRSEKLEKFRNHRSNFFERYKDEIIWLDGSGRRTMHFLNNLTENGLDCRGTYDKIALEHYPLRSLGSYIAKKNRGDVVVKGKSVSERYWRVRNFHEAEGLLKKTLMEKAKELYENLFYSDRELMNIHSFACEHHKQLIDTIMTDPEIYAFAERLVNDCWRGYKNELVPLDLTEYWPRPNHDQIK